MPNNPRINSIIQDLLRATEYTGASGVYAIRYYVNGQLSPDNHRSYCILDSLQEEYLHQTYNSMPDMTQKLNMIIMDPNIQWNIYNDSRAEVTRNKQTTPNITKVWVFEHIILIAVYINKYFRLSNSLRPCLCTPRRSGTS